MSLFASTFRWLQRKRYQYEVTFSLYMLTPTEKFIFNSVIFIIFSMVLIAVCLYFPQHIAFVTKRAWFYYHGEDAAAAKVTPTGADEPPAEATVVVGSVVVETVMSAFEALKFAGQHTAREL